MIASLKEYLISKKLNFQVNEESLKALIMEFSVYAKPASKVEKMFIGPEGVLVIQTRVRPVEGEANEAIRLRVAELFGISKYQVEILRGEKSKSKRIKLKIEFTTKHSLSECQKRINDFLDPTA